MRNGQSILKQLSMIFCMVGVSLETVSIFVFASVTGMGLFAMVMCIVGSAFLLTSSICFFICKVSIHKTKSLIEKGIFVYAQITEIKVDSYQKIQVDRVAMHPYYLVCQYVDAGGKEYHFKSKRLLYNPSGLLSSDQIKVYVDLKRPNKYYVDTTAILPETAVLHKFKRDTEKNARELIQSGKCVIAKICGVEWIGMIKLSGIVTQRFLKLPVKSVRQMGFRVDEQGHVYTGYTILCKYTAIDGITHIFASKYIQGEPNFVPVGKDVKVYYKGRNFRKYHVAVE